MKGNKLLFLMTGVLVFLIGCEKYQDPADWPGRIDKIPVDAVKMNPSTDLFPPILHSVEFETPVPMPGVINSAGAEDSPFMANDRDEFFFFFTPDVTVPIELQIMDSVTGIYMTKNVDGNWQEPKRVFLQDRNKLSLDGCQFVKDDIIWFCSAREGYTGLHWFTAEYKDGIWTDWKLSDFDTEFEVGELHFYGDELYYHSYLEGGQGDMDIWKLTNNGETWDLPQNISNVNTEVLDGYPCISDDGRELWFTRWYLGTPAVFRSILEEGEWQSPELIVSQFAGEPTLDSEGNLYFVHHFYDAGEMIEADIYVAMKK